MKVFAYTGVDFKAVMQSGSWKIGLLKETVLQ